MNKKGLRIILISNEDNQGELARYLGISEQTLSKKINEREGAGFNQREIKLIKDKYNLSPKQVDEIFFDQFVS